MEKHNRFIVELIDLSIGKNMVELKKFKDNYNIDYSFDDALNSCRSKTYIIFRIRPNSFLKLDGVFLNGPLKTYKYIVYTKDKNSEIYQEWNFYKSEPDRYNDLFENHNI